ncbi:AAA family ATPase [soil metagenome]
MSALRHLSDELHRSRALVLVTSRPQTDVEPGALGQLLARASVQQRELRGLDRAEISDVLQAIGGGPVDGRYADFVLRHTGGNTLYVAAVGRALDERLSLASFDPAQARAALTGRRELVDLVREPLGRISAEGRRVVELASVAGEEVGVAELTAASRRRADSVLALLAEATAAGLLTFPVDSPGAVRFVHALVRDGVYDTVDKPARADAHRALAAAITELDPERKRIGEVARHLTRGAATAAEHEHAAAYAHEAGQAAIAGMAYAEAVQHLASALHSRALAGIHRPAAQAELLLDLAFAHYRSGAFGSALEHCEQAADLAEREGRPDLLARAALLVDGIAPPGGVDAVAALCRRALPSIPDDALALRAQLQARLAYVAAERGDLAAAATMSAEAMALAARTGDPAASLAALRARHQALSGPQYTAERLQLGRQALALAAMGEPLAALWGHVWRVDAAFEFGNIVAVDQELSALAALATELRFPLAWWHLARLRAAREAVVGRFAAAEEQALAAWRLASDLDDVSVSGLHVAFVQYLTHLRGQRLSEASWDGKAREFIAMAGQIQLPIALASAAQMLVSIGDADEARRLIAGLTEQAPAWPLDGRWIICVSILADAAMDVGDVACAEVLYPLLLPYAHLALAGGGGTVACQGAASRQLGRLAAACHRLDDAEGHLRDAIRFEERMGARPFAALSRMHLAEVLHARGRDLPAAVQSARTALAAMRAMDMPGRAQQCERVLAAIEADLNSATAMTPREREVATLVADGLSNRQIATRLFVSERTVETHVSHVLAKLGGKSRVDIARWVAAQVP